MATHGNSSRNTTVQVDGMMINGVMNDGQVQAYTDNALVQEATYQTSGVSAEVSAGGVRLNMIPKEGGNTFKARASSAAATATGRATTSRPI